MFGGDTRIIGLTRKDPPGIPLDPWHAEGVRNGCCFQRLPTVGAVRGTKKPSRKTVGRMVTIGRPDHASACSCARFDCVFFLGPALLRGGLASIGPADGEAATQEFSIGAGRGQA